MTEYTALLALPDGSLALEAAGRIPGAGITDNEKAGVWVTWTAEADSDEEGINILQEIRLRAEMHTGTEISPPEDGENFTLFLATPFVVLRGRATVIHSEEVICI